MLEQIRRKTIEASLLDTVLEPARLDDVDELVLLFETFFAESGYGDRGIVYAPENARAWLQRVIEYGITPHIVARLNGKIIGAISYDLDKSFCIEPVAVLHLIYVLPEHRRTAIGRLLVGLAVDLAKRVDGACAFHAPVASGMTEMASLENLFLKAGFAPVGFIMGRAL